MLPGGTEAQRRPATLKCKAEAERTAMPSAAVLLTQAAAETPYWAAAAPRSRPPVPQLPAATMEAAPAARRTARPHRAKPAAPAVRASSSRSEERRVGKEC